MYVSLKLKDKILRPKRGQDPQETTFFTLTPYYTEIIDSEFNDVYILVTVSTSEQKTPISTNLNIDYVHKHTYIYTYIHTYKIFMT